MKKPSTSRMSSETDWERVRALRDDEISLSTEHPEASVEHIVRGIVRRGFAVEPPKRSISLRVDADVLDWFKTQGVGYQTRINSVLRAFRDASIGR